MTKQTKRQELDKFELDCVLHEIGTLVNIGIELGDIVNNKGGLKIRMFRLIKRALFLIKKVRKNKLSGNEYEAVKILINQIRTIYA
jgi:hypothetical protein